MSIFSKLAPKSPDGRRIAMCILFIVMAELLVFCLKKLVLFSDVRVSVALDLFQIFGLTLLGLAFCFHSNRKEKLAALCVSFILLSLTNLACGGKIHAKCWRFRNPKNYSLVILEEIIVKGKTIRKYLVRDQKFSAILVAKVEPINQHIALYWPLAEFGHTDSANLSVHGDSLIVTSHSNQEVQLKVFPLNTIP